ncbi:hypothetical protein K435DRAFT_790209 [Dendrothele bispora CBS 962.96]|uniref:BOD1/SHG1 domain-containing protein n=1 Tax=Dendrothele bispora (strain CBS 962.96) TaxID=1314807 RepID=A0A4S8MSR3_DENBC|nr:hypothetical protein K435DRAFT_790209 [Dendrothele bispora CBS 962.96]
MPISNPNQLVEEFKKSGEFDRLRRELLAEFQKGLKEGLPAFKRKLEDIGRDAIKTKRAADMNALFLDEKEKKLKLRDDLVQDIKRFPVVERAVADMQMFSDPAFVEGIHSSSFKILRKDRGETVNDIETKASASQQTPETDESTNRNKQEEDKEITESKPKLESSMPTLALNNSSSSISTPSGSNSVAVSPINTSAAKNEPVEQNLSAQGGTKLEDAQSPSLASIPATSNSRPDIPTTPTKVQSNESDIPPSTFDSRSTTESEEQRQKMGAISVDPPQKPDTDSLDVPMHPPKE